MRKTTTTSMSTIFIVSEAYVGKAMVMKRFSPRARGRAGRIEKRSRI